MKNHQTIKTTEKIFLFIFKRCKCKQYIVISGKKEKGGEGGIWRKKYAGLGEGVRQKRTEE